MASTDKVNITEGQLQGLMANIKQGMTLTGTVDPTTSTVGKLGQIYLNTTSGKMFVLTEVDEISTPAVYTWVSVGSSSETIHLLTAADVNYPTDNPTQIWLGGLESGFYLTPKSPISPTQIFKVKYLNDSSSVSYDMPGGNSLVYVAPVNRDFSFSRQGSASSWTYYAQCNTTYRIIELGSFEEQTKSGSESPVYDYIGASNFSFTRPTGNFEITEEEYNARKVTTTPIPEVEPQLTALQYADTVGAGVPLSVKYAYTYLAENKLFTSATASSAGTKGLVPAPFISDANKFLNATTGWTSFPKADYEEQDSSSNSYILNRPFYTETSTSETTLTTAYLSSMYSTEDTSLYDPYYTYVRSVLSLGQYDQCPMFTVEDYNSPAWPTYVKNGTTLTLDFTASVENMETMEQTTYRFVVQDLTFESIYDESTGRDYYRASGTGRYTSNGGVTWRNTTFAAVYGSNMFAGGSGDYLGIAVKGFSPYEQFMPGSISFKQITTTETVHQLDSKYIKLDPNVFEINEQGQITLKTNTTVNV